MQKTLLSILHFNIEEGALLIIPGHSVIGRCNDTVTSIWEQNKKTIEKKFTGFLPCQVIRLNVSSDYCATHKWCESGKSHLSHFKVSIINGSVQDLSPFPFRSADRPQPLQQSNKGLFTHSMPRPCCSPAMPCH